MKLEAGHLGIKLFHLHVVGLFLLHGRELGVGI
jgi:hypothetical protein